MSESDQPSLVTADRKPKPLPILACSAESAYSSVLYNVKNGESCTRSVLSVQEKNEVYISLTIVSLSAGTME